MGLKLNGATSGSIELDPQANLGSDRVITLNATGNSTLTLPDANGTLDRLERAGNILQVVSQHISVTTTNTTSTSYINTGWGSWSITPVRANSKFILEINGHHPHCNVDAGNKGGGAKFYRSIAGGSFLQVTTGHNEGYFQNSVDSGHWWDFNGYGRTWDAPSYSLGQTLTYQYWFRASSQNTAGFWLAHTAVNTNVDQMVGTITIMEVAQ